MKRRIVFATAFLSIFLCVVPALSGEDDYSFSLSGLRTYWFGFVPTGLDLTLAYTGLKLSDGLDTIIETTIGGGYEESFLYRDADGSPYSGTDADPAYMLPNGQLEVGIIQGIVWNDDLDKNLASVFAFYRTRFEAALADTEREQVVFDLDPLSYPDSEGLFGNSLLLGVLYDDMSENKVHRTSRGILAETSVEWGPNFLLNDIMGDSAFTRISADTTVFVPIFDTDPKAEKSVFSMYLGNYTHVDYALGESIPIYVSQTMGGTFPLRKGLGDSVRGFEKKSYDTRFKAVNNLEIRVNGPSLLFPKLIPGLIAYVDAGYYAGYDNDPSDTAGGFLVSTGIGVNLWILGLEYLGVFIDVPLKGDRMDEKDWVISIPFGLHF